MPIEGYNSSYLAEEVCLGQAICFVRPIQRDLDIDIIEEEMDDDEAAVKEECFTCGDMIKIISMKQHLEECRNESDMDDQLPAVKRRKHQTSLDSDSTVAVLNTCNRPSTISDCPICDQSFQSEDIAVHAASCGEKDAKPQDSHVETMSEELQAILENMSDLWIIRVIRRSLLTTAMDQLNEAEDCDWGKTPVEFIGEEGIDAGGLLREFFSMLFQATDIFEGNNFSVKPKLLDERQYYLLGKAVATAILHGHPGPRCLNKHITNYILTGLEPNFREVDTNDIFRADATTAIKQIEEATSDTIDNVFMDQMSVLEATGYTSKLSVEEKDKAITAIKAHFLLYRVMAPIHQFMEGLKLHGILGIMRKFPKESEFFLCEDSIPKAEAVLSFYKASYSEKEQEKAKEEVIMYNFSKFLTKVERGKITTTWIDPEDGKDNDVELNMEHILQAFLGCKRVPVRLTSGHINFDHMSSHMSTVNTYEPSIIFSNTDTIQEYTHFQESLMYIVVGAYGFGRA